jgi:SsrA-binding protein
MAVEIKNKKASFEYFLTDEFTAGMQLVGSEIKSIRAGKASITEAYCRFHDGEFFLFNAYIAEYPNAGYAGHESRRQRKLLLKKVELRKLEKKLKDVGVTVVPTLLFIGESGYAKLKIAVAKGKKLHDKRDTLKQKDIARDLDRRMD